MKIAAVMAGIGAGVFTLRVAAGALFLFVGGQAICKASEIWDATVLRGDERVVPDKGAYFLSVLWRNLAATLGGGNRRMEAPPR